MNFQGGDCQRENSDLLMGYSDKTNRTGKLLPANVEMSICLCEQVLRKSLFHLQERMNLQHAGSADVDAITRGGGYRRKIATDQPTFPNHIKHQTHPTVTQTKQKQAKKHQKKP